LNEIHLVIWAKESSFCLLKEKRKHSTPGNNISAVKHGDEKAMLSAFILATGSDNRIKVNDSGGKHQADCSKTRPWGALDCPLKQRF